MKIWMGWDPHEMHAFQVAQWSLRCATPRPVSVNRLALLELRAKGWYRRPTTHSAAGVLTDVISETTMTTEHTIARFFVPHLAQHQGWALFTDGDVLFRRDVADLFALADDQYAVMCVKHPPLLAEGTKKDGKPQTAYSRKNWSSVMLINCGHPAHRALTLDVLNSWHKWDLHAFSWLEDDLIGELPPSWNYLVNVSPMPAEVHLAHYTLGVPTLPGHGQDPFAEEWFRVARFAGYHFDVEAVS